MNDILNELLANATAMNQQNQQSVPTPVSLGTSKQNRVAEASASKISQLGGEPVPTPSQMYAPLVGSQNGAGAATASDLEYDIRTMPTFDLERKYGHSKAAQIIANRTSASNSIYSDQVQQRDLSQTAADLTGGVALGAVNAVGGIAALGAGLVNDRAGQFISNKLEEGNEWARSTQSAALKQRRNVVAAEDQMDKRDSDQQFEQDKANGDSNFMAGLKRVGRGIVDGVANAAKDSTTLSDLVAEGAGSLVALGPVSRAAKASAMIKATAAKDAAIAAGKTVDEATAIGAAILAKEGSVAIPVAIGAMEAGGSYQGNVNEVSKMTHEQLMTSSPAYAELIADGVSPIEAKATIGGRAGLLSAAITAPFAVAAGKLVSKFEGNPLALVSGKTAGRNVLKETAEEGAQGITGALAQNVGIQTFADEAKTLSEGVGEQGGRGALAGAGMAGVLQAPSLAIQSAKTAGKAALESIDNQLGKITNARDETNRKDSHTSIENLTAAATTATEQAPAIQAEMAAALDEVPDLTPEVKTQAQEYFSSLVQALAITPEESEALGVSGSTHKLDAMGKLIEKIKTSKDPQEKIKLAMGIHTLVANLTPTLNDERNDLPDLPPTAFAILKRYDTIVQGASESKDVTDAMAEAAKQLQTPAAQAHLNQEQPTQESVDTVIAAATLAPETVNPKVASVILKMATSGKLVLTDEQRQSIQAAQALMEAAQAYDTDLTTSGLTPNSSIVSKQVKTGEDAATNAPGEYSGLQHIRLIAGAMAAGKTNEAKERLISLGKFAQSQTNKVLAFNAHYAAGRGAERIPAPYVTATGDWKMSKKGYGVTPDKPGSIAFAKNVAAEARFLTRLHNNLVAAYGLEQQPLDVVELDAVFRGKATLVATEFANGTRKYANEEKGIKPPVSVTPETPAEPSAAVTPTPTPAPVTPVTPKTEPKKKGFLLDLLSKITSGIDSSKPVEFVANPEQQEGIDKIRTFLTDRSSDGDNVFVLEGKAGTGKTSLVQEAIDDYLKQGGTVHVAAISHKAKGLLEFKLNSFIKKRKYRSKVIAKSVAGLLGMKPIPGGGFGLPASGVPEKAPIREARLIIVDEASMIDKTFKNLIEKSRNSGVKVIYLGDKGQLAPVGSSEISPIFTAALPAKNKHQLTVRVRQGEDSSILPYADYYWNNSAAKNPTALPIPKSERKDSGELQFIQNADVETEVMPLFKKAMQDGNNSLVKVVVYNNKAGDAKNAAVINVLEAHIREVLFGEQAAEYEKGEFIIMNDTFVISEVKQVENSREFVVKSVDETTTTVDVNGEKISLDIKELSVTDAQTKEFFVLPVIAKTGDSLDKLNTFNQKMKAWAAAIPKLDTPRNKAIAWQKFYDVKAQFADLGYSYAITSHKAQGSTYDVSVVLEDNFNAGFKDDNADRSRAIYTALTRASKMAVIVSRLNAADATAQNSGTPSLQEEIDAEVERANQAASDAYAEEFSVGEDVDFDSLSTTPPAPPVSVEPVKTVIPVVTPPVVAPVAVKPKSTLVAQPTQAASVPAPIQNTIPTANIATVEQAFPNLVGIASGSKISNFLAQAFKIPENIRSRLFNEATPLATLKKALSSNEALSKFLGGKQKGSAPDELLGQYQGLLIMAGKLTDVMKERLQTVLAKGYAVKGLNGDTGTNEPILKQVQFKALNITEPTKDGGFQYNQSLLEAAALAGLHWFQTTSSSSSIKEEADIAAIMGIAEEDVTPELMNIFNGENLLLVDILPKMANAIRNFWGLQSNNNFDQSMVDGIPLAIATEVLEVMLANGIVEQFVLKVPDSKKTINMFSLVKKNVVTAYPSLLGELVEIKPEETMWFGDDVPPVATTQMNNAMVENTQSQQAALEKEQQTPFFLNESMFNLVTALGKEFLLDVFGGGNKPNADLHNKNHLESQNGRNTNVVSAFNQMNETIEQLKNRVAATPGATLPTMPIRYAYNMSRTGRMHMLGRFNPQASKLMREVFMPTGAVIDLTNTDNAKMYDLALAQMLGVKIHTKSLEDSRKELNALLEGDLKEAITELQKFHEKGVLSSSSDAILQAAIKKADGTVMALHAMMDYARFTMPGTNKAAYNTAVYVEADGVTNGPANAVLMLSRGQFTEDDLVRMGMGGFFLKPGKTMNDHRTEGTLDMYQTTAGYLERFIKKIKTTLIQDDVKVTAKNPELPSKTLEALERLMGMFIGDIALSEDGKTLTIKRGVTKNPLTVTIYGAGLKGLTNKMVAALLEGMYEKFSDALQKHAVNPKLSVAEAMFGDVASANKPSEKYFEEFNNSLTTLTQFNIRYEPVSEGSEDMVYRVKKNEKDFKPNYTALDTSLEGLKTFTVEGGNLKALTNTMQLLFVKPMQEAIEKTVGSSVLGSANLIQVATQLQSLAMAQEFKDTVETLVFAAKNKGGKNAFLSRNEQRDVLMQLEEKYPFLKNGLQTFHVGSSGNTEIDAPNFAASLSNRFASLAVVPGPADAGVAGIPYVVIGMGDGLTMQDTANDPNGPTGTLKIFDGVNIPLAQILSGSLKLNESVFKAWQRNPIRMVLRSFEKSAKHIDEQFPDVMAEDVELTPYEENVRRAFMEQGVNSASELVEILRDAADSIDARHAVMKRVAHSVDQMASAGQPYQNQGKNLSNLSPDEQVVRLNEMYQEELSKIKAKAAKATAQRQGLIKLFKERANQTKVMELSEKTISALLTDKSPLDTNQKDMLRDLLKKNRDMGYVIYSGTREQIKAAFGVSLAPTDFGHIDTGTKQIFIVEDNAESIIHELVHGATIDKVITYFTGNGELSNTTKAAIENLIKLQEQFESKAFANSLDITARESYGHTLAAMNQANTPEGNAIALNEMMAWVLANKDLAAATKKVTIIERVMEAIRSLVQSLFGTSEVKPDTKFYDALLFSTLVIAEEQPSIATATSSVSLKHNAGYGMDANLIQIERNLSNNLVAFANTSPLQKPTALLQARRSFLYSSQLANTVRTIFPMTGQEYNTFQAITATLATEVSLDPNALVKAQDMYVHALKNLDARSFMQDPTSTNQAEEQASLEKYELLVGKSMILTDMNDRSSLLPVFLALGATNKEFREVMNKIGMPKTVKHPGTTFDNYLRNYSNVVIDALSNRASGTNKSKSVQEALDALNIKLYELAQQKESMLESLSAPVGSIISSANTRLVQMMTKLGEALYDKADIVATNTNNKWIKSSANIAKLFSGIASEKTASAVAEGVTNILNKVDGKQAIVDLFNDMVGRTESNANVYDMIKRVRTAIQQLRQNFRENVPEVIASKFTKKLTEKQFSSLFISMGKTDLVASATGRTFAQVAELLTDHSSLVRETKALENKIRGIAPAQYALYEAKMKQLANSMINGIDGNALLRNANAINALVGLDVVRQHSVDLTEDIDQLTTLYAIGNLSKEDIQIFSSLVRDGESDGLQFMFSYLKGQRKDEVAKAVTGNAYYNAKKGFIPSVPASNMTLVVANDSDHAELVAKSYVRVGKYNGTPAEPNIHKSYYYLAASARPEFAQGIMQNVVHSSGGVNISTGLTIGTTAGIITDPVYLAKVWKRAKRATSVSTEGLVPVFDFNGDLIALERTLDPAQLHRMKYNTEIHKMIGVWRGRQVEEATSSMYNDALIKNLHDMYTEAVKSGKSDQYVNLFDIKDPVMVDAVKLLSKQVRDQMALITGTDEFFVRKTTLADALGYRNASVGDMWSGNSRWSPKTQEIVKNIAMGVMGNKAYRLAVNSEKVLTNFVSSAKSTIVVKSVIVPAANIVANLYYLVSRNVSPFYMKDKAPQKIQEIEAYVKSNIRLVEAEAELRAFADDKLKSSKLEAEIKSINDAHKRLSIWPLLEAGEFSSISDVGLNHEDVDIAEGKWVNYLDAQVDKLPLSVRNAGRYAWVTQDTALFQGLQKMVQYGDFLGKAILYDDLIENKGLTSEQALARITEEFVNYDRLPGRFRGYMEQIGLLWFYNFKIRIMKVALSTIRNNPLHALLVGMVPTPEFLTGPIGSPMTDNGLYKAIEGSLDNSIGMGQGFNAPFLNPWYNLVN